MLCCRRVCRKVVPAAEDIAQEAGKLRVQYAADLGRLAAWCRQNKLADEAEITIKLVAPPDPYTIVLPVLPRVVGSLNPPEGAMGNRAQWQRRLMKLRQEQAAALFALAQRSIHNHQASPAYRLAMETIEADPDHEAARRVFGYEKYQNQWHTPFEVGLLRQGMVWHDKFGWIEKASVPRWERGERPFGLTWIGAAEDAKLHAEIATGWDILTEHYRIRCDHSIEAAVALGVKLENLHRIWRQIFLGYYAGETDVEALFSGRPLRSAESRLEVVYFRSKDEYHRALKPSMPEIGISMGLYVARNHTAYFYAGSEDTDRTMYHEATHQLFQQSRRVGDNVGGKANFWLMEGIAMYMETLRREGDCFVLGGLDDTRMQAARYHLEKKDFYVPFDTLVRMGLPDVQGHAEIAKLYSQIAAMTNFLIHYDDGRYRDALVKCLAAIYDGSQDPELLARTTGIGYAELDKQYQEYMKERPKSDRGKSETRNPKSETNSGKSEIRNRNDRDRFGFGIFPYSNLFRISSFGFRISTLDRLRCAWR